MARACSMGGRGQKCVGVSKTSSKAITWKTRINSKLYLKKDRMRGCGLDSAGCVYGSVVGCCQQAAIRIRFYEQPVIYFPWEWKFVSQELCGVRKTNSQRTNCVASSAETCWSCCKERLTWFQPLRKRNVSSYFVTLRLKLASRIWSDFVFVLWCSADVTPLSDSRFLY